MIFLNLVPLVRPIFFFALNNLLVVLITPLVVLTILLVVFVAWIPDFFPIGIESIGDVVTLVVLVPIGVESKGGQFLEIFWR